MILLFENPYTEALEQHGKPEDLAGLSAVYFTKKIYSYTGEEYIAAKDGIKTLSNSFFNPEKVPEILRPAFEAWRAKQGGAGEWLIWETLYFSFDGEIYEYCNFLDRRPLRYEPLKAFLSDLQALGASNFLYIPGKHDKGMDIKRFRPSLPLLPEDWQALKEKAEAKETTREQVIAAFIEDLTESARNGGSDERELLRAWFSRRF